MSDSETRSPRRRIGAQDLIGLVAVIVATVAAFAAIFQTQLMAKHQSISVWPYLQMWAGIAPDADDKSGIDAFSFNFANKGVGPAIIESVDVRYNGKSYPSLNGVVYAIAEENGINTNETPLNLSEASVDAGEVVEAGEARWVVKSSNKRLAAYMGRELYGRQTVEVDVCYCSLYRECWRLIFPSARPEEVERCEAGGP